MLVIFAGSNVPNQLSVEATMELVAQRVNVDD